jgi:hypothetical protein
VSLEAQNALRKLGFGLGPDLTITGNFNLNKKQKEEFMKIKWLINFQRTPRAFISPTHKRTEGRAPVWGSEFTSKDAALQGGSAKSLLG